MRRFENQSFAQILERPGLFSRRGNCVEDLVLEACNLDNCSLSIVQRPESGRWSNVRTYVVRPVLLHDLSGNH